MASPFLWDWSEHGVRIPRSSLGVSATGDPPSGACLAFRVEPDTAWSLLRAVRGTDDRIEVSLRLAPGFGTPRRPKVERLASQAMGCSIAPSASRADSITSCTDLARLSPRF